MLSSKGGLFIAELIFYLPVWVITVLVCRRQGWKRSDGWIFLFLFVWMRLAGAIAGIIADLDPQNIGAIITSTVMNAAGTSTLLAAQLGILRRLNAGMSYNTYRIPQRAFDVVVLGLIAIVAIAIAAGVYLFSSDPERMATGLTLSRVTGGLTIGLFGLIVFFLSWTTTNVTRTLREDRILLYASWIAFPFLLAKVVYLALTAFRTDPEVFNYISGNIWAMAFMSVVPEFFVVIAFLGAGWKAPSARFNATARAADVDLTDRNPENTYKMHRDQRYTTQQSGGVVSHPQTV